MLLVSGSASIPGVINISNDESFAFECYVSGSLMSIEGIGRGVLVWMEGTLANIQWVQNLPNTNMNVGAVPGSMRWGIQYVRDSGLTATSTEETYKEIYNNSSVNRVTGYGLSPNYIHYAWRSESSGHMYLYRLAGAFSTGTSISTNAFQTFGSLGPFNEFAYIWQIAVKDDDTVYLQGYDNSGNSMCLWKYVYSTDALTQIDSKLDNVSYGVDGIEYFWDNPGMALYEWQGKSYVFSVQGWIKDSATPNSHKPWQRIVVIDTATDTVVAEDYQVIMNSPDSTDDPQWTNFVFYQGKMCWVTSTIDYSWEGQVGPQSSDSPHRFWMFDMNTDTFLDTHAQPRNDWAGGCYNYGAAVDQDTGIFYVGVQDRLNWNSTPLEIMYLDLASPTVWNLRAQYTDYAYQGSIVPGRKYAYYKRYSTDQIYRINQDTLDFLTIGGNVYSNMDIFIDETAQVEWGILNDATPTTLRGFGFDSRSNVTIHLDYEYLPIYDQTAEGDTQNTYLILFTRGIIILHTWSYHPAFPDPPAVSQNEVRIFRRV